MINEAEAYTAKENAKAALLNAINTYVDAANAFDMDDEEQMQEINDVLDEAGKRWEIIEQ